MKWAIEEIIMTCKRMLARSPRNLDPDEVRTYSETINLLEELKAYRETGLTPEEVKELEDKHWSECRQIAQYSDLWKPYPDIVPQNGQKVIVQLKNGYICMMKYDAEEPAGFMDYDTGVFISKADAWMPMPERYKGKNEK